MSANLLQFPYNAKLIHNVHNEPPKRMQGFLGDAPGSYSSSGLEDEVQLKMVSLYIYT